MFTHAPYAQSDYSEDEFRRERSQSYDSLDSGDLPLWAPSATLRESSLAARGSPLPSYPSATSCENGAYSGWQEPVYGVAPAGVSPASVSMEMNTQTYYNSYRSHHCLQQAQQQQQQYVQQHYHNVSHGSVNQSAWVPGQYPCPDYQ